MRCPECHFTKVKVNNSRPFKHTIRRRRECVSCGYRWTTFEATHKEMIGMSNNYKDWTEEEEKQLVHFYQTGKSTEEIAKLLERTEKSVIHKRNQLTKNGLFFEIMRSLAEGQSI